MCARAHGVQASPTGSRAGPPPWPACVVGASGPRGREAVAGGCGQDGLDLFRLRRWERSGDSCAGRREGWGSEKGSPSMHAPLDLRSSLCSLKGVPLIHCEELGNYPIFGPLSPNLPKIGVITRASWHTAFSSWAKGRLLQVPFLSLFQGPP